jgi:hypothetical protein
LDCQNREVFRQNSDWLFGKSKVITLARSDLDCSFKAQKHPENREIIRFQRLQKEGLKRDCLRVLPNGSPSFFEKMKTVFQEGDRHAAAIKNMHRLRALRLQQDKKTQAT